MSKRIVKFGDMDLTVNGKMLKTGDQALNFTAKNNDLTDYDFFKEEDGKIKILSAVPSLDTSVCELQTYLLHKASKDFPDDISIITVSNDLPFAQKRFSDDKEMKDIEFVSDYINYDFAKSYSLFIEELHLLNRSLFVIDKDNIIRHAEYLDQNTELPDIDMAINVALELAN